MLPIAGWQNSQLLRKRTFFLPVYGNTERKSYNDEKYDFQEGVWRMNEIITKLNEIEEKANAILSDAKERKEIMMAQLQKNEREIDKKYDRMLEKNRKYLTEKLRAEAEARISVDREQTKKAMEELDVRFSQQKERLAEEILWQVIY